MHVSIKDIAKSGALSHDLDFIMMRYAFVDRCGFYKHPTKSLGLTAKAEPPIASILHTNERAFLNTALKGMVTLEEYNVFLSAYHTEGEKDGQGDYVDEYDQSISYAEDDEDEPTEFRRIPDPSEGGKKWKGKTR
jgi:hypothetical protein